MGRGPVDGDDVSPRCITRNVEIGGQIEDIQHVGHIVGAEVDRARHREVVHDHGVAPSARVQRQCRARVLDRRYIVPVAQVGGDRR